MWTYIKIVAFFLVLIALGVFMRRSESPQIEVSSSSASPTRRPEQPSASRLPELGKVVWGEGATELRGKICLVGNADSLERIRNCQGEFVSRPGVEVVRFAVFNQGQESEKSGELILLGDASSKGLEQARLEKGLLALVDSNGQLRAFLDGDDSAFPDNVVVAMERLIMEGPAHKPVLDDVAQPAWLERREQEQEAAKETFPGPRFSFSDERRRSGINFLHRCTDDAGSKLKSVHYDHGNGVAAADIDGDGLVDVYFPNQIGPNSLWKNLGNGQFQDITKSAGVGVPERVSVTASFADVDNDGDPDLYVTAVRDGNLLFENVGNGKFRDISESSGLNYKGHSSAATFFDYNNDGLLDVFVSNIGVYTSPKKVKAVQYKLGADGLKDDLEYYVGLKDSFAGHLKKDRSESSKLYKNLGGLKFSDVTEAMNLLDDGWTGDAMAGDFNGDGHQDLYGMNMQGNDRLWIGDGGNSFVDKAGELLKRTPWGSMGGAVFDYNQDGLLDILITDMHSDMSDRVPPDENEATKANMQWTPDFLVVGDSSVFGNAMYVGQSEGGFKDMSESTKIENYWPWGPSIGDFNSDGFVDVFIASSMNFPFRYGINSLLMNDRGKGFVPSEFLVGVEPRRGGRTAVPWFNADMSDSQYSEMPGLKGSTGQFTVWAAAGSRSGVCFDLENDGDLDLITTEFNYFPQVLVNSLTDNSDISYLKVKLSGHRSNRAGLGAIVRLTTEQGTQTQLNDGRSGYLSQSDVPLYFGLGSDSSVKEIEVIWPSGRRQVVERIPEVNRLITIEEPD